MRFIKIFPAFLLLFTLLPVTAQAQEQSFADWLTELRAEARDRGISEATLDSALATVKEPIPRVIELDHSQPEFVQTFSGYMRNRISQTRIDKGRSLMSENRTLLQKIQGEYGVQPHYLMSFWALESNFGSFTGGFPVIDALATLAYDPRRSDLFRGELLTALRIIDEGNISVDRMTGSWAGAMGQLQFMPSTFMQYAVDGDGDGRIDIWDSVPDVLISAANYLSRSGWHGDERWGREVVLPDNFDFTQSGTGVKKSVTQWNNTGVTRADGSPLGDSPMQGSIVLPAGAGGPAFLTYSNFRTTMVWNRSTFYAISVGHLADRIAGGGPILHMPAQEERPLSRAEVMELQELLNAQGMDAGTPDGMLGSRTRAAVREFQARNDMPTDGYANYALLERLRQL